MQNSVESLLLGSGGKNWTHSPGLDSHSCFKGLNYSFKHKWWNEGWRLKLEEVYVWGDEAGPSQSRMANWHGNGVRQVDLAIREMKKPIFNTAQAEDNANTPYTS